jgi:hypothetical protein
MDEEKPEASLPPVPCYASSNSAKTSSASTVSFPISARISSMIGSDLRRPAEAFFDDGTLDLALVRLPVEPLAKCGGRFPLAGIQTGHRLVEQTADRTFPDFVPHAIAQTARQLPSAL